MDLQEGYMALLLLEERETVFLCETPQARHCNVSSSCAALSTAFGGKDSKSNKL